MLYLIPLLQSKLRFSGNLLGSKAKSDPKTMIYTLGGFVLFLIVVFIINKIYSGQGALKQYKRSFKKKAKEVELSKHQIKILVTMLKGSEIKNPLFILTNPISLNSVLRKGIKDIKKENINQAQKQSRILEIYRIKHHLDNFQKSSSIRSTNELISGARVIVERNDKKTFESSIIGNYDNFYCIKLPLENGGGQVKWKKGSILKIIAFDRNDKEAVFLSKTLGIKNVGKTNTIILSHSMKSSQKIARSLERVDVSLNAYIYPVEKYFNKSEKRHVFKANRNTGRVGKLVDLSSGGCALQMSVPFSEGSLIELEFDLDNDVSVKLQGKILRVRFSRGKKITHIKFTRASSKNLNLINNFIYSLG